MADSSRMHSDCPTRRSTFSRKQCTCSIKQRLSTFNYGIDLRCVIDLQHPAPETGFYAPVKISTMRSSQGITIAGGFCGEYSMHVDGVSGLHHGYVTQSLNGITNHIEIIPARTRGTPLAVFASNDKHVRMKDTTAQYRV